MDNVSNQKNGLQFYDEIGKKQTIIKNLDKEVMKEFDFSKKTI